MSIADCHGGDCYRDQQGRILFVSDGISCGKLWTTFYRKPNGSLKRYKSPRLLPLRRTRIQAQRDLDAFAILRNLTKCD